ncbi:transglutaminase family protein [Rhodococcus sp. Eu-32]|uniref:transglutaminase family protein n=1 Tax=Rhodococcus sp. Eu-32 TaxID=1017319 RepID=UPI000DF2E4D6|nr:transglutaminase family protein [Rhodococcus sp. Eu-32]RRQ28848.1 transglutaminase family protein [Rhodococcus sp. Eu-32]
MGIKVALEHRTSYSFDRMVRVYPHEIRLRPAPHSRTPIEAYSLTIEPAEHFVNWQQDVFGNFLARVVFPERTDRMSVTVGLVADMAVINPLDFFVEDWAEHFGFEYEERDLPDLEPYLRAVDEEEPGSGPGPVVTAWVEKLDAAVRERGSTMRTIDFLVMANRAVLGDVEYSVRMEPGVQTPDHTLTSGVGSCRDSAWLLVSVLRQMGLAARFVSGYLVQLASDVRSLDGPSGPSADFTDLHAWTEVYLPGAGWVGLDPTSGLFAGEGHIPLSATPHPSTAAAISGATGKCEAELDFSNTVVRVHEDPRTTLPYTAEQWTAVRAAAAVLDERMSEQDIRLTVGGEPTFVAIENQEAPEWNTTADGPHKRRLASDLAERLRTVYAPDGLVQRSQGKWYPGEPLPRWQIGLFWRTDGESLWRNSDLVADPWLPDDRRPAPVDPATSRALVEKLVEALGLPETQARPAYEDPLVRLLDLVRQPYGDPPHDDDIEPGADSAETRAALLRRLESSTDEPAAFVLPISRSVDGAGWQSADWTLRRGRLVLLEGDSPAGLRLPLNAITWAGRPPENPDDPTAPKDPLPQQRTQRPPRQVDPAEARYARLVETNEAARGRVGGSDVTALVAEVRDGILYVFMPPTNRLDDFVELVTLVENAAAALDTPVVVEGYGPPSDPRIQTLTVTPDPGVIEVNVQPTSSWGEQDDLMQTLYEQARQSRLSTEGFDNDGTTRGTGGGNHITLGGTTPSDSPILRRPDLLVSLLTHWQRHPSLSYLFSGRFIGTTSQAPRVDEGREEALYELEVAFSEIARMTDADRTASPWVVDRALRHLLTDITGNTHRAEFCIDKLYSPDSTRGRLGLLELRGFEMPPHHQMAMVQSLLVRSLVSRFWDEPLKAPLVRHGANLHGRYMLPHFVTADIGRVAEDLREHGIDFDTSWLDPFTEFRFPRIGTTVVGDAELELRGAIEPWNTLGEESTSSGTARYVDSSVERIQVRVAGADDGRYLVTCNGVPVPLLRTDRNDVQVAGVRYRAWQPPSALHPTIEVQSPLHFDVVEKQTGRAVGGCTYHVVHPGGRSYDGPPVNAVEAESRRNGRFEEGGFAAGKLNVARLVEMQARQSIDVTAPGMLDLRRTGVQF